MEYFIGSTCKAVAVKSVSIHGYRLTSYNSKTRKEWSRKSDAERALDKVRTLNPVGAAILEIVPV